MKTFLIDLQISITLVFHLSTKKDFVQMIPEALDTLSNQLTFLLPIRKVFAHSRTKLLFVYSLALLQATKLLQEILQSIGYIAPISYNFNNLAAYPVDFESEITSSLVSNGDISNCLLSSGYFSFLPILPKFLTKKKELPPVCCFIREIQFSEASVKEPLLNMVGC